MQSRVPVKLQGQGVQQFSGDASIEGLAPSLGAVADQEKKRSSKAFGAWRRGFWQVFRWFSMVFKGFMALSLPFAADFAKEPLALEVEGGPAYWPRSWRRTRNEAEVPVSSISHLTLALNTTRKAILCHRCAT